MYETILYDVKDHVATITLNRPANYNSFNRQMLEDFENVWKVVKTDDDVHVVVLRAAPCPAFCTGADVSGRTTGEGTGIRATGDRDKPWQMEDPSEYLGPKTNRVWKPVIVAVSGMAAGGAFYWLNEADIIICSDDATFFDPHVTFAMVAACEPVGALARMPLSEVQRMTLLGNHERISATTALRISLVTEITAPDKLWERANELAGMIASKHPVAIQGSVRAIWEGLSLPHKLAMDNAFKYTQIGNPISTVTVNRATQPKAKWVLR